MKTIILKALNDRGTEALKQHWAESRKMNIAQRKLMALVGYEQRLESESPYTIILDVKNRNAEKSSYITLLLEEISDAFEQNGAQRDVDYMAEVLG